MNPLIEISKKSAINGMEMFLRNFSHVPDDKLNWTPAPTAKSALRIAAHTALYASRFAKMIREAQLPQMSSVEMYMAQVESEELAITDRAEIEPIFRKGTEEVWAALDTLTPELIESTLQSGPDFSMSMRFLMTLPGWHATLHCGQIDFLQTCWGDQEIYF